ncbi:LysR family transcriptional regulator [Streptomyces collinus]|uniref:LysR family transcriptional regulator n=1 Tax=Streptomyces collinus TaxID=42684 RepID=UPI001F3A437F|nr:LysR family transcriptional regulator [Streptomyces collinus]UJA09731.1 LysR family transcriptional regulator [Streptomyces collinus]UJA15405.1 LysR family transcriptional regulator [Streptomyces collinus]
MELRLLVTFEKVAAVGSFTRAAAELAYAQSSVTGQVRALESSLGVELFDRLGSRIRLTEAGERLLPCARRIIELTEEARAAVTGAGEPSGTLTVGTMESLTSYRLPPLLEYFHHRHPGVRIALRTTIGDETRQALRQGTYDVGFLMEEETGHPGLESVVLAVEPLALVAAPGHAMAGRTLATADLTGQPLLATEPGCAYRDLFERELTASAPVDFLEFGTIEATKRAAAAGLGIALLPEVTVAAELAEGSLVRLAWEPPFTLRTQLAWRSGRRLAPHVRLFVEQARRLVSEQG